MRILVSLLILMGLIINTSCQANSAERPIEASPTLTAVPVSPIQGGVTATPFASTPTDAGLQSLIEKAKADLSKQFAIQADQIRVVEARAVTWPDASLGCPQSDLVYAQVLTPGYWVLLEANGKQYPYHADQAEQLVLCPQDLGTKLPAYPPLPVNPTEIKDGVPWVR